jgi:hypothetical protein
MPDGNVTRGQAEVVLRGIPISYIRAYLAEARRASVAQTPGAETVANAVAETQNLAPVTPVEINFTLGADPEFEFHRGGYNGRFIAANSVIRTHMGALGTDGHSSTGELRPGPGDAETVFNNVKRLIARAQTVAASHGGLSMFAGCGIHEPLGGHIHFGNVRETPDMVTTLGKLIATPLRRISNTENRGGYGRLDDTRRQTHGWEYRAPCSWLSHPAVARGVLVIAQYVAYRQKNVMPALDTHEDLAAFVEGINHTHAADIRKFKRIVDSLYSRNMRLESVEVFQAWARPGRRAAMVAPGTLITTSVPTEETVKVRFVLNENLSNLSYSYRQPRLSWHYRNSAQRIAVKRVEDNLSTPIIYITQAIRDVWCSSGTTRRGTTFEGAQIRVWTEDGIGLNSAFMTLKTDSQMAHSLGVLRNELGRSFSQRIVTTAAVAPTDTEVIAPVEDNPVLRAIEEA